MSEEAKNETAPEAPTQEAAPETPKTPKPVTQDEQRQALELVARWCRENQAAIFIADVKQPILMLGDPAGWIARLETYAARLRKAENLTL